MTSAGTTSVTLGGVPLMGVQEDGSRWRITDQQGWFDGSTPTFERFDRGGSDGSFPASSRSTGRQIILEGVATFIDPTSAKVAGRRLRSACSPRGLSQLVWEDALGETASSVELNGAPKLSWPHALRLEWALNLYAPDPVQYGPTVVGTAKLLTLPGAGGQGLTYPLAYPLAYETSPTPGLSDRVFLPNSGETMYWPQLRLTGGAGGVKITGSAGDVLAINQAVPAEFHLDINCRTRQVLLNGSVSWRHYVAATGGWLGVPPGGADIVWTADSVTPEAVLSVTGYERAHL